MQGRGVFHYKISPRLLFLLLQISQVLNTPLFQACARVITVTSGGQNRRPGG